ncbi:MAG: iron-containing alcohol dehydrogenase [Bacteroidetes bacterium]|nr:iron-containing alcohol dehydrogenase [Bacteroidota bacterium]
MENFVAYNPTRLYFGKDVLNDLGRSVKGSGHRVLLIYGGGSIKHNGIYDKVMEQLNKIDAEVFEYPGIRPNPIIEDVDAAAKLGKEKQVDIILAVGGGSVIDSAKIISITIPVDHTGWYFYSERTRPHKAIPLIAVPTLAATGSEMNPFAVVQNNKTRQKIGFGHDLLYPRYSFLDPQNTFSVPRNYTAYGIADMTAHCLEAYFGEGDATLSDRFVYAILQEAIACSQPLLNNLHNYDLRAKVMYAATAALNKLTINGRKWGDWGVHSIGHVLSLLFDLPHGASLSIVYPAWLKFHRNKIPHRIAELGKNVFGVKSAGQTIEAFETFFRSIECPVRLIEMGIGKDNKQEIINVMKLNEASGNQYKLAPGNYAELVEMFL